MKFRLGSIIVVLLSFASFMLGQTVERSSALVSVPSVIQFSNVALDPAGNPLTGTVPITFSLYNNAQGGEALWTETQSVTLDNSGHYNVYLGITKSKGLPVALFTTGQALWLGAQVAGEAEPQRVALVSVPYAMKAGDATTIGGLPPSAFAMANSPNHPSGKKANPASETQNFIPLFIDNSGDLGNSILFQSGTAAVGIGTTTPSATLEVNGTAKFDGLASFASGQTFPGTLTGIKAGTGITVSGSTTDPTVGINATFANEYYAQLKAANTFTANQTVNGTMTATNFSGNGSGLTNVTATNSNELGGLAPGAFAQLGASSNTFSGSLSASSFTGGGSGLSNVNAAELGGMLPSAYQPAGSYATTGANSFTGNQSVTGNVSATESVSGVTGTFTGLVTESGALLPSTGTATASQGYNSNAMDLVASAYNSTAGQAQNQDFRWLTAPAGNNSGSPSGALTLLFGANGAQPTPTGLSVASNGQITFASNQTFPGTGTITGVSGNNGISGGGSSGSVTLGLAPYGPCASGSALTAVPFTCTPFATLGANTFTASQSVTGNITASGTGAGNITASGELQGGVVNATTSFDISGATFAFGNSGTFNAFLGFAGNSIMTGGANTGSGFRALFSNSSGGNNTASGWEALYANSTGSNNTASGYEALEGNGTGSYNTALGSGATVGSSALSYATAIGAGAMVSESNALVLGGTGAAAVNVGIGTTTPGFPLDVNGVVNANGAVNTSTGFDIGGTPFAFGSYANENAFLGFAGSNSNLNTGIQNAASGWQALYANSSGSYNTASGSEALLSNSTGSNNTAIGFDAGTAENGSRITGSNNTLLGSQAMLSTGDLNNATAIGANASVTESNALVLGGFGPNAVSVGIGTDAPAATLDVRDNGSGNNTISATTAATGASAVFASNAATSGSANGGFFDTHSPSGTAVVGINYGSNGQAGYFQGNVTVTGTLSKGGGSFKIDHPLDPANKYLYHSFVESPDMMNIYNGMVTLGARGSVWITLPDYFEALNQDFRYQLTSIGRPQPSLYVAREISGNRFKISGGKPGGKVSWQVTGIRHDAYANAHRIPTEEMKPPEEQGRYLHPELFGAPAEQAIGLPAPSVVAPAVASTTAKLTATK